MLSGQPGYSGQAGQPTCEFWKAPRSLPILAFLSKYPNLVAAPELHKTLARLFYQKGPRETNCENLFRS